MKFHGVLFDMDGLLLDSERLVVDAFQQTVKEFDLPDLTDVAMEMIGLRSDLGDKVLQTALMGLIDHRKFDTRWHERIHAAFDQGIPLKTGVAVLLGRLAEMGLPCAVATSTKTTNAEKHLTKAGIANYFCSVTGGDQVKAPKPDPEIYHLAASSIGLSATECCAFEDSDPGTTAAIASGAITVQIPDIKQPSEQMRKLGHFIAPNLLSGAKKLNLI